MADPFVIISISGPPRGKGRPRTRVIGNFATIYTDAKTRRYEASIADAGAAAMKVMGLSPLEGFPVSLRVMAYMPIPKSWNRADRTAALAHELWPISTPDADNIAKCAGDALNGICWDDDSRIVNLHAMKIYSDRPRLEIEVYRW